MMFENQKKSSHLQLKNQMVKSDMLEKIEFRAIKTSCLYESCHKILFIFIQYS